MRKARRSNSLMEARSSSLPRRGLSLLMAILVPWHAAGSISDQVAGSKHTHAGHAVDSPRTPEPLARHHFPEFKHSHDTIERHVHPPHDASVVRASDERAICAAVTGEGKRALVIFDALAEPWLLIAFRTRAARAPMRAHSLLESISGKRLERPPRATQ